LFHLNTLAQAVLPTFQEYLSELKGSGEFRSKNLCRGIENVMKSVKTILFVENDAVALTMYQKRLQREGFYVEIAEDGIAALKVLSEITPDIVILDLMLPKFSGRDVFDYMRADKQFGKVPVIIFSNAPKSEWPQNIEDSPTRALPKSEANFSSLLALVREMTAAAPAPEITTPAMAQAVAVGASGATEAQAGIASLPELEPIVVQVADNSTLTIGGLDAANESSPAQTVEQFLEYATAEMTVLREYCLGFIKGPATDAGRSNLSSLSQRLHAFNIGAQKSNCARLALLAGAWEALIAEIVRKPSTTSPSILQTLAQAADCLRILLTTGSAGSMEPLPKAKVLSVDDDEICNHVAEAALEKANMQADSVMDAKAALEMLTQNDYDMVLLDINMPGYTGFELCEKLRALPHHQKTPVIFVTAYNNFENRKQSVLSGGGDLIAKPVSPLELALKVTIHLLKAPPKTVTASTAQAKPEPALVWKEPTDKVLHDTEIRKKAAAAGAPAPTMVSSTTETRTAQPEAVPATNGSAKEPAPKLALKPEALKDLAAALKPSNTAPAPAVEKPAVKPVQPVEAKSETKPEAKPEPKPEPKLEVKPEVKLEVKPEAKIEAKPEVKLEAKPAAKVEPKLEVKPAAKLEIKTEPKTEPKPVVESVASPRPLPEKEKALSSEPPRINQPAAPPSAASSKPSKPMNKEINQQFETLVLDVAHIIFGDNAPEINVRLVRMAMEQVWANRANLQSIDSIAREIARIIFGEQNASDLNVRLVRMALERSNSIALFKAA
jgi:DNA-binding response OmpR family regulator